MIRKHTHKWRGDFESQVWGDDESVFLVINSNISSSSYFLTVDNAKELVASLKTAIAEAEDEQVSA